MAAALREGEDVGDRGRTIWRALNRFDSLWAKLWVSCSVFSKHHYGVSVCHSGLNVCLCVCSVCVCVCSLCVFCVCVFFVCV